MPLANILNIVPNHLNSEIMAFVLGIQSRKDGWEGLEGGDWKSGI